MTGIKLRFIKPCRETDSSPILTPARVEINKNRNTETSLLLDLNILVRMEDVLLRGGNSEDLGLMGLVNFINQCTPASLCLSPGFALREVHPKYRKQCFEIFEVFLSIFCPQMVDHPTATRSTVEELEHPRRLNFEELPIGEQYLHTISYYSLIQIHIIDSKYRDLPGHRKFDIYINSVCNDIDILSAVESEIAKYCFCKKKDNYSEEFKDRIEAIKQNFLQRNSNKKQRLFNIFNGVQDIRYGAAALKFSEQELCGKNQETWVATLDSKLYWLTESIHHFPVRGEPDGKYYSIVRNKEQDMCEYWCQVDTILYEKNKARKKEGKTNSIISDKEMEQLHSILVNKGFSDFNREFS